MRAAEELRYLVLAAQREGNRTYAAALRPLGLTPSQAEVLRVLDAYGPLTLSGLGDLLVCESGNSPSRLVDRLVGAGLVERTPSPDDGRAVVLALSAAGARASSAVATIEDRLHAAIDDAAAGQDLAALTGLLRAFVADAPSGRALERRRSQP